MNLELKALRNRVALGNDKLHRAWLQMKDLEGEGWQEASDQYDKAVQKLELLNIELKAKGYIECLYFDDEGNKTRGCINNPDDPTFYCRVCPCDRAKALEYSEGELFEKTEQKALEF